MSDKPPITPLQAMQWWKAVAEQFAVIAANADDYLLDNDVILDRDAVDEILGAIVGARTAADTAFGANFRAAAPEMEKAQRKAQEHRAPTGQPQYATASWLPQ